MDLLLHDKNDKLRMILAGMGGGVIAFSGGVDSTLLFAVAAEVLGESALAVTAASEIYPELELTGARKLAEQIGGRHLVIHLGELDITEFCENSRNRCYYCKKLLFGKLSEIAEQEGFGYVLDGTNVDDAVDYRPGRRAAEELLVRSPLVEAGFNKQDIRDLSSEMGLSTFDKPALACLASRIPYGTAITTERLNQVGLAEESLRGLGFRTLRVRHHGHVARIELGEQEFERATGALREEIVRLIKAAGFTYVSLDLQGYRAGAMNEGDL